jgi:hypothetical protein
MQLRGKNGVRAREKQAQRVQKRQFDKIVTGLTSKGSGLNLPL